MSRKSPHPVEEMRRTYRKGLKPRKRRTIRRRKVQRGGEITTAETWLQQIPPVTSATAVTGSSPLASFNVSPLPMVDPAEWSTAGYFLDGAIGETPLNIFEAGAIARNFLMPYSTVQEFQDAVKTDETETTKMILLVENALRKSAQRSDLVSDLSDTTKGPLLIFYLANATSDEIFEAYQPVFATATAV